MCGIVGYVGAQQAAPILLEGLQKLEYRGYDSAGIAVLDGSTIELAKACGEIKNLLAKTHDGSDLHGYIGLGHTRWATHGAPTEANAHPHVSNDGKFAIVQNGIIENFMELREMLQAKGFRFHSETDTEVIVHLLDMYYTGDGNLKDTVMKTLGRLEGSYAIGILCADCPEQMFLARNGCPINLSLITPTVIGSSNSVKNILSLFTGFLYLLQYVLNISRLVFDKIVYLSLFPFPSLTNIRIFLLSISLICKFTISPILNPDPYAIMNIVLNL